MLADGDLSSRFEALDEVKLWRGVAEGTAAETGEGFFATLVRPALRADPGVPDYRRGLLAWT